MNKEVIKIIIKVLVYALGLIGTYFGVSALTSCTVQRQFDSSGRGTRSEERRVGKECRL